jgi:hypothetical protein
MVTLVAMVVVGLLGQKEQSPLDQIPALQTKVSMDDSMLPLRDFASQLQASTQVPMVVSQEIADRKIGAFFKDRPAAEVMHRLESTLFVRWVASEKGLRLVLPKEIDAEERSMIQTEKQPVSDIANETLRAWAAAGHEPYDQVLEEIKELRASASSLEKDPSPAAKAKLADVYDQLLDIGDLEYNRENWELGSVLDRLGPSSIDRLMNGQAVAASNDSIEGVPKLPAGVTLSGNHAPEPHSLSFVFLDRLEGDLKVATHILNGDANGGAVFTRTANLRGDRRFGDRVRKEPLFKRLEQWRRIDDASILNTRLDSAATAPPAWLQQTLTASDQLGWLYHMSGVPIICDAYRMPATYVRSIKGDTIREWLANFATPSAHSLLESSGGRVHTEGGWLLFRQGRYWRLLESEIPESKLRPFEKPKRKPIGLDELAQFASTLTVAQESRIDPKKLVTRFSLTALVGNVPALRLWADLPSELRDLASKDVLPVETMPSSSRDLYVDALYELAYKSGVPDRFLSSLVPGAALPTGIGLMVRSSIKENTIITNGGDALDDPGADGLSVMRDEHEYDGVIFRLGSDSQRSISYFVPLTVHPKKPAKGLRSY